MINLLRLAAAFVLIAMLAVTTWASSEIVLWKTPRKVVLHPWFIATLFDTYWAFVAFYLWVGFKQTAVSARVAWFVAINTRS